MGKKTLEEIGKILLVSMISILVSTSVARRQLISKKLDKATFENYVQHHNQRHTEERDELKEEIRASEQRMTQHYDKRHDDLKDVILSK